MSTLSEEVGRIIQDVSNRRAQIKEDFIRAYLAERLPKGEGVEWVMANVKMVETWSADHTKVSWHFEALK